MLNVLLITADQWRGRCTGYAGHPIVRTPHLDALAADGTAFLQHFANAAPCSPARACLYTGLYQMNNRVVRNGTPLSARFDNIALAARRAGYTPTLFGYTDQSPDPATLPPNDPALTTYEGVLPGFDIGVKLPEAEEAWLDWLRPQGLDFPNREAAHLPITDVGKITNAPPAYTKNQTQTAFLVDKFSEWLGTQSKPWFAHLSLLRPHPPFIVPAPYNSMFAPDEVDGPVRPASLGAEAASHPLVDFALRFTPAGSFAPGTPGLARDLGEADYRQIRATYYGMIAEVDDQLGRIFGAIRARGDWDNTLVIFTSDHAEMLGDHFLFGKGGYYDQSQHIPLIIRDPRTPQRGTRIEALTEAVDVYPTLLDALAVEPANAPDGETLLPLVNGIAPARPHDAAHWEFDFRDVAGQTAEQWFGLNSTELNMAVIRTREWKYVHFAALPPLLFDLRTDPDCFTNLAGDSAYATKQIEMAERLLSWRARHLDQSLALKELTPAGVVSRSVSGR